MPHPSLVLSFRTMLVTVCLSFLALLVAPTQQQGLDKIYKAVLTYVQGTLNIVILFFLAQDVALMSGSVITVNAFQIFMSVMHS